MSLQSLPTSFASRISQDSSYTPENRAIIVELGGGYEKRAGRGVNSHFDTWDLSVYHLTRAELDTFITFWKAHGLVTPWRWDPPENTGEKTWRFASMPTITNTANRFRVEVSIREVSDFIT